MRKISLLLLSLALLCGCLMGPNYKKPQMDLPSGNEVNLSVFTNSKWWEMFDDPVLNSLEEEALANNKDLVKAMARVDEARASVGLATADQLPQITAGGSAGAEGMGVGSPSEVYQLGAQATFTVDLWGRYRRLSEAARAQLLSTESAKDTVRLALTADVATYYFGMVTLDEQLSISKRTLKSREESVKLYKIRYENGYSTELELKRVEAERASVKASVSEYERQLSQSQTALAVLLGRSPKDIIEGQIQRGQTLKNIRVIPEVPTGLPADLLTRRPDVRQAEGQLIAANANVGAARAAFFPTLSLTAQGGYASDSFSNIFDPKSAMWNAIGGLVAPVFTGGKLRAEEKVAQAQYEQMLANYEKTVQNAYKNTYDALVDNQKYRESVVALREQKDALAKSLDLSQKQKDEGLIGMLDLLDVERNLLQAEISLASAERNQLNALVGVSQALGGGWMEEKPFPLSEEEAKAMQEQADKQQQPNAAAAKEPAKVDGNPVNVQPVK